MRRALLATASWLAAIGCSAKENDEPRGPLLESCVPTAEACLPFGENGPGADCLAKADNRGRTRFGFRVSQIAVTTPPALTQPYVRDFVITEKVTLAEPECMQFGSAQYNWLLEIDLDEASLTTGGGPPQSLVGPANEGTCYAELLDEASGAVIHPTTVPLEQEGEQWVAVIPEGLIPVYFGDALQRYVVFPTEELRVALRISEDRSCIGRFAPERLRVESRCRPDPGDRAWNGGGTFEGYVPAVLADTFFIPDLGNTWCVLLSGDVAKWRGPDGTCISSEAFRAEGGFPEGDWCSATNDASCERKDAWRLEGEIAASGIEIAGTFVDGACRE